MSETSDFNTNTVGDHSDSVNASETNETNRTSNRTKPSLKTSISVWITEEWTTEKKKTNHKIRNVQTKVQRHLVLEDGINLFAFHSNRDKNEYKNSILHY